MCVRVCASRSSSLFLSFSTPVSPATKRHFLLGREAAPSLSILGHAIGENFSPFVFSLRFFARSFFLLDEQDTKSERARTVTPNRRTPFNKSRYQVIAGYPYRLIFSRSCLQHDNYNERCYFN